MAISALVFIGLPLVLGIVSKRLLVRARGEEWFEGVYRPAVGKVAIAALLMTFFFTQMRPMIDHGHLYLACPPLFRVTQGAKRVYCLDEAEKNEALAKGLGGKGKMDVSRFKGLGEMDAKDLKETTMNPETRKLIRVTIDEDEPGETGDLVERLMGKKPELRFQYIQENARFVEELDV